MSKTPPTLKLYRRLSALPLGKRLFVWGVCRRAPYFASIRPALIELKPGHAEMRLRKRRAVLNHLGTVHAIAACNLAEFAMGMLAEVTVPASHRWIPKAMTVEYLKKAGTDLTAVARPRAPIAAGPAADVPIDVDIVDTGGAVVTRVVITIWVTPKREA